MNLHPTQKKVREPALRFLAYFVALFILAASHWIRSTFGGVTVQQISYHLYFLHDLIFAADEAFLITFVLECLVAPVLLSSVVISFERYLRRRHGNGQTLVGTDPSSPGKLARVPRWMSAWLPAHTLLASLLFFCLQFSVFSYAASRFGEDRFSQQYIDPAGVQLEVGNPRNLILIYVESLETTYADPRLFGRDLLERLNQLSGVSFNSYRPAPGTEWTIAGLVSSQCAVPLQFVTRMRTLKLDLPAPQPFLPGAVCLSDILHHRGYRNVFLGGADLSFAGKRSFLSTHHYDEAYGFIEWLRARTQLSGVSPWGVYDDDLFRLARDKLKELHDSGGLFNLTLLTLDTHHPAGHYSNHCRQRGAREFQDIVQCTSEQVVDFVSFVQANGYLEDTNIVIVGDHLAMPNPVYETLNAVEDRRIFNKFISTAQVTKNTEEIAPFDLLPTILEFIGIDVVGDRLGLGYSAFFEPEVARESRMHHSPKILNVSPTYERLWTGGSDARPSPETSGPQS